MGTEPTSRIAQIGSWFEEILKVGAIFYVLGFVVIMVRTSQLHCPVIQALEFQNILAGWPIALAVILALLAWPPLKRAVTSYHPDPKGLIILVVSLLLSVLIVWVELNWFGLLRLINPVVLVTGTVLVVNGLFLGLAYQQSVHSAKSVLWASTIYLLLLFPACLYAIVGYPRLPQYWGGGRPAHVQLYFKSPELSSLLGGSPKPGDQTVASDPVYLYYRTSDFLLVSKDENSDQQLIQVPSDQIHAVVWLQSRSKPQ